MGLRIIELVATLVLHTMHSAYAENILPCSRLESCPGKNEICIVKTQECVCKEGFVKSGTDCETPSEGHGVMAAVITVLGLALLIVGLILIERKYKLIDYMRQKILQRRSTDVMYEDVMIGQDDPPLSP